MSKGSYRHLIYALFALIPATYLTFWGPASSWSGNAWLATWWVLNVVLLGVAEACNEIIHEHPAREKELYKWFGIPVRLKHLARYTKHSFHLILIFHLSNELFPDICHMIATGSGILGLALMITGWYEMWSRPWWKFNGGLLAGVVTLVLAFGFNIGEVAFGELLLAIVGFIFQRAIKWKN